MIGRHLVLRSIATGGMAEVYLACSGDTDGWRERVAIKKLLPEYAHDEHFTTMLVDEAKISVLLSHPNIAQVYEIGLEGDSRYFIVMEYVDGLPLSKVMQRLRGRGLVRMPFAHAIHIAAEMAQGLEHAHGQLGADGEPLGIVHRDVSPQNVMISYSGEVKLIDFGIARAEGRLSMRTNRGTIKGKLRYLAPEIAVGQEPDARADIFCAGIVLFEMLAGEALYNPRTEAEAIEMASEARIRSPRDHVPDLPASLESIVLRSLCRAREDRYASAQELASELSRLVRPGRRGDAQRALGALMRQLFEEEIAEIARLDARAEKLALRALAEAEAEGLMEATTVDPAPEGRRLLSTLHAPYRRLVTRIEPVAKPRARRSEDAGDASMTVSRTAPRVLVSGADGGEPMAVVPADARLPRLGSVTNARAGFGSFPGDLSAHSTDPGFDEDARTEAEVLFEERREEDATQPVPTLGLGRAEVSVREVEPSGYNPEITVSGEPNTQLLPFTLDPISRDVASDEHARTHVDGVLEPSPSHGNVARPAVREMETQPRRVETRKQKRLGVFLVLLAILATLAFLGRR